MQILNFENGLSYLKEEINKREGEIIINQLYLNQKRYALIKTNRNSYFALFKRDFFNKFGDMFAGESGKGETINIDSLKFCFANNIKRIFYVYENGKIYYIHPEEIFSKGHKREIFSESKPVYSFSIKNLRRYNL